MLKTKKMRLGILLILIALIPSGCQSKDIKMPEMPSVSDCALIFDDAINEYFFFCVNKVTKEEKDLKFNDLKNPVCNSLSEYNLKEEHIRSLKNELKKAIRELKK